VDLQGLGSSSSQTGKATPSLAVEIVAASKTNPHVYQAKIAGSDQSFSVMLPQKNVAPRTAVIINSTQLVLPQTETPILLQTEEDRFVVSETGGERLFQMLNTLNTGKGEQKLSREDQKMLDTAIQILKELPPQIRNELLTRIQTALGSTTSESLLGGSGSTATPQEMTQVIRTIMSELVESLPAILQKTSPENRDRALKLLTQILFPSTSTPPMQTGVGPLKPALDQIVLPQFGGDLIYPEKQSLATTIATLPTKQAALESVATLPNQILAETPDEEIDTVVSQQKPFTMGTEEKVVAGEKMLSFDNPKSAKTASDAIKIDSAQSLKQVLSTVVSGVKIVAPDGKTVTSDVRIVAPDGKNVASDGKNVAPDGKIFTSDGKLVEADGKIVTNGDNSSALLKKSVAIASVIDQKTPLHLVNYEPVAVDKQSSLESALVPVGRYLKIADSPSLPTELGRYMATRFPAISQVADIQQFISKIAPESFQLKESTLLPLEQQLLAMPESQRKTPFVATAVQAALASLTNPKTAPFFERIISQIEPVQTTIARLESIVDQVNTFQLKSDSPQESQPENAGESSAKSSNSFPPLPRELPQPLKDSADRLENALKQASESFTKLFSPESLMNKVETAESIKKMGDLWGIFLEGSLKKWGEGEARPEMSGIKQELKRMNHLITKELVVQAVPGKAVEDSGFKTFLKELGKSVAESIHRIDGGQILSEPQETPKERSQMIWIPVQVGQEWTRMGIEFRREKSKKGRGDSLANRVAISLELKKMGTVNAELDLDSNKQLRVKIGTGSPKALQWFNDHRDLITKSLQSEKLRAVFVTINAVRAETETKKPIDSFRVSG